MKRLLAFLLLGLASPTAAEVVNAGDHGFELRYSDVVAASPSEAMQAFGKVGAWWNAEHTYSGKSENLSMALRPGGCFCETLPNGGGIEHMRVIYVDPGKRVVLTGSLGPLLYEATSAVLDVRFAPAGSGTKVTASYKVAGFANGGAAKMAPLIDRVMAEQLGLFFVYTTPPVPAR